ncbi:MAG: DUF374 domain-containing protein [Proteobacteria bacterium]|nr:DUF374 domain-containing protein [Pseudomonadota bacterium]
MLKRLTRHPAAQAAGAWLLGQYLRFALGTTRWTLDGAEHIAAQIDGAPVVVAFWHERLPLMPALWLHVRRMRAERLAGQRAHVLVSLHRDGRFIGAIMRHFHIEVVLGSSSRGGAAALRGLLALLSAGDFVAITPDGPRGPRRTAAPGVAQLAALSGVAVLPCAAQTSRKWVLKTWDRMVLPRPFARGVVVCLPLIEVPRAGWQDSLPAIEAALIAAADRADALCPS